MHLLLLFFLWLPQARAQEEELPKWEIGAGAGGVRLEHYPGAAEYTQLAVPFPTFQYRGKALRADDRGGAKLFLFRSPDWTFQFGGLAFPPLSSSSDTARAGMDDLPLIAAIGPQLQRRIDDDWAAKVGIYQAIALKWLAGRTTGALWELDLSYRHTFDLRGRGWIIDETSLNVSTGLIGASDEMQDLYYEVPREDVAANRPEFNAQAGILQSEISVFESFKRGDLTFYIGARLADFASAANRASPLLKADRDLSGLIGFTYTLYKSKVEGVREEDAPGIIRARKP